MNESTDQKFLEQLGRHVSHQLNNPIASIGSAAYLIEDILAAEVEKSEAIKSAMPFVASIREDATRLKVLVDELRRFFVTGNFLPMRVDLIEFLKTRTARAASGGLSVTLSPREGVTSMASDLDLGLMQSAFELLFTELPPRGIASVAIDEDVIGDSNVITLRMKPPDGLTPETAPNFFEPLPFGAGQGLGLTLPYIRKVIEMHSGTIRTKIDGSGDFIVEISLPIAQ